MSDDLVKRLRELDDDSFVETMHGTAADRIEELEAKLARAVDVALHLYYGAGVVTEDMHNTIAELKGQDDE